MESSQNLQPDNSAELLRAILIELRADRNGTAAPGGPPLPPSFKTAASAVRVNVYWYSSLVTSLAAALIAILAKQWINYLLAGLSSIPIYGARHRQFRIHGMHKWNLPTVISILPLFLHAALLLVFAGIVEFVWDLDETVGGTTVALVVSTSICYLATNVLAYAYPECPYKTSMTVLTAQVLALVSQLGKQVVLIVKALKEMYVLLSVSSDESP